MNLDEEMGYYRAPKGHLNYNEWVENSKIEFLILHYTVADFTLSYQLLTNQVSSHYLVNKDGRIDSLVSEEKAAWHAGVSYWRGRNMLNSWSIGIEIVNTGSEEFTED